MGNPIALILGITGQDGSYLAEILLEKGYDVHGLYRRSATGNLRNIQHLLERVTLHKGDLADSSSVYRAIVTCCPDEVYNEADQDNVGWSFSSPGYSYDITGAAVGGILESIKTLDSSIKFFQPVSATMFGDARSPQDESTPFDPQSPYACAKVMAYYIVRYYRETYGMFACTAIFYNHDSPRRTEDYLLQKICRSVVRIASGSREQLSLGNHSLAVDIGFAREYMQAAYDIMQLENPDDFVIATGVGYTILDIAQKAFRRVGLSCDDRIVENPIYSKPQPVLIGNTSKARSRFGFENKCDIDSLIGMLIRRG